MRDTLTQDTWRDDPRLTKWIPFVGPGAALVFLAVIALIFVGVFS